MKTFLITFAIVLVYAAGMIYVPSPNQGFDQSWDCPSIGRGAVVCVRKP